MGQYDSGNTRVTTDKGVVDPNEPVGGQLESVQGHGWVFGGRREERSSGGKE